MSALAPHQRRTLEDAAVHAEAAGNILDNVLRGWNPATPEYLEVISDALKQAAQRVDLALVDRYPESVEEGSDHD